MANKTFAEREQDRLVYAAKSREILFTDHSLIFNGTFLRRHDNGKLSITQKQQCATIECAKTKDKYVKQRAKGAYVATMCQPEAAFDLSLAAQSAQNPDDKDFKLLNKRLQWQLKNKLRGLTFVPVDASTAKLFVFVDASFANNKDMSSQLGFLIAIANEVEGDETTQMTGNIVHWSSTKCKRVTRSVLASELYAMTLGFDHASVLKTTIDRIFTHAREQPIPNVLCTDSWSLYKCLVKLGTTNEKRLMIDIMALQQAYKTREIAKVRWIDGATNLADAMTKLTTCDALKVLIDTNTLSIRPHRWVERPGKLAKLKTPRTGNSPLFLSTFCDF